MILMIILLAALALWTAVVAVVSYIVVRKATISDVRPIVVRLEQQCKDLRVALSTKQYQQANLRFDVAHDAAMQAENDAYLSAEEEADVKLKGI